MIGQKFSHYRIIEQIGAGGMGVVYRAYDERLDRTVAIKVLPPDLLVGEAAQKRFRREALALARINHPNIATLHDVGSENGTDYLVMEDIQGTTLEARTSAGPLPIAEVLSLAIQICEGLAAAHDRGIIHRDLKPGNMCLTPDGRLKILDFGLAERAAVPSQAGVTVTATHVQETSGTVPYMAPEQLQGQPADLRSDLWAVGAVLYELSCGRRPFTGNVVTAIAADIIHKPPPAPRYLRPEIPVGLERVILKCLEKDPSNRYVSARAALQDLKEVTAGTGPSPLPPAPRLPSEPPSMEIAHVLFMDIVAYSTLPMDEQEHVLRELQEKVRSNHEFVVAQAEDRLIRLPTGDGMALVFFGDAEAPVRCALELARNLGELKLRMGINSGPVYRVADINANHNVAGAGINMAQRVMDCGDAGHILVSKPVADVLAQVTGWPSALHDLGEAEVKHGVRVHVFNLYKEGAGNPAIPQKLRRATKQRRASLAGIAALVLGLAAAAWLVMHLEKTGAGTGNGRRSIAVLGFRNLGGKPTDEWMSTSLSEMLTTELGATEQLRTLSGEDVTRAKLDLNLPESESLSASTLAQLRKRLGSDMVVVGSYLDRDGQLRVDIRLQDTSAGGTVASFAESGTEAQFFDIVSRLGSSLRAHCGIRDLTPTQSANLRAALPANPEAARLYAEGLERLREFDPAAARDKFEATVAIDPNNAMAYSALSSAWSQLGYDGKAAEAAKKAFDLSQNLAREDRLSIEGAYYVADKQWDKAIEAYRNLYGFFPDNLEYGLSLADAQVSGSKAQDALATVSKMRAGISPKSKTDNSGSDPRIDLAEARAAAALSDYRRAQAAASRAAEAAVRRGDRLERGQALLQACSAFRLGQVEDAKRAGQQAREIFADAGYALGQARSLTCIGNVLEDQGDFASAQQMHEAALSLAQSIGARLDIAGALNNLGNVLSEQGKLEESNSRYQQAIAVATEIGDRGDEQKAQSNIGGNLITLGQFRSAQKALDGSLAIAREIGDQQGAVESLINLGTVSYSLGDLAKSEEQLNEALTSSRSLGLRLDTSLALGALGDVMLAEDKLAAAEAAYRESLGIAKELDAKDTVASAQLALAGLAVERGDLANAETMARGVAQEAHARSNSEWEMSARNLLAHTLTFAGKMDEANTELKTAAQLTARDETSKLTWAITEGQLLARQGKKTDAARVLSRALSRAREMDYVPAQLQARLALITAEVGVADRDHRERDVRALIQDATKLHFHLVARKAGEAEHRPATSGD
jgi:serine/threonine protein kinase/tetratricopeptide (TPR) repeat protein/TolB-like protein